MLAEVKGGGWQVEDWSPDDKQLSCSKKFRRTRVISGFSIRTSGERKELTPRPAPGAETVAYFRARFAKDGKGIYVTTDRESEFARLAYIDLASGKHTYLCRTRSSTSTTGT